MTRDENTRQIIAAICGSG